jgi:endonuclease VIII
MDAHVFLRRPDSRYSHAHGERWMLSRYHMRVAIHTGDFVAVAFQVPVAEFHTGATLARHPSIERLGPDILSPEFDEQEAAERLRARPELEVGVALMRQSLVAGIGNVFKSEACFASGVNPFRLTQSLSENEARCLMSHARRFMSDSVIGTRNTTRRADPSARLWVYNRTGEPCRKCGATIRSRKQGDDARVTFWCPNCQPDS